MPGARGHPLRPHAAAWVAQGEASLGTKTTLAERVREMDAAFEDAGLDLIPVAHSAHAALSLLEGNENDAIQHSTAAAELALATGNRRWGALLLGLLGVMLAYTGRPDEAIQRAEQALAIASEVGMQVVPAQTALGLALSQTDPDRAIPYLESAWKLSREFANEPMEFSSGSVLARVLTSRGNFKHALEVYDTLIDRGVDTRNPVWAYLICDSLGTSLAAEDRSEVSAVILGATSHFDRELVGFRRQERLDALNRLQTTMGPESVQHHFARGQAMTMEELLDYSRDEVTRLLAEHTANSPGPGRYDYCP
jgi:tetratricopeptide (TPR) repeat protein